MTITPCDKKLFRSIAACVSCDRAIIKERNLDRVIKRQEIFVQKLATEDSDSVEYRTELSELDVLMNFRDKVIAKGHSQ